MLAIGLLLCLAACKKDKLELAWSRQNSGTDLLLHDIHFINADTGYVCGGDRYTQSLILKTTNGGGTWETQNAGIDKVLFDVSMLDNKVGYASGYDNKVLRTNDGGATWNLSQLQGDIRWLPIYSIFPMSSSKAYVVGGLGYNQGVFFFH